MLRRVGLPTLAGSILAGFILGPSVLGLIDVTETPYLALFIVIGINFLLFLAGAEELGELSMGRVKPRELSAGILILLFSTLLVAFTLTSLTGVGLREALTVGVVMGIVSVGPLVKGLMDTGRLGSRSGVSMLVTGLVAEVSGIIAFNSLSRGFNVIDLAIVAAALLVVVAFGRLVFVYLLHLVEKTLRAKEAPFAILVALVLMASFLAEYVGFNAAIVALMLGVFSSAYLLERPEHSERLHAFTYGFFEPLFFAGIGLYVSSVELKHLTTALAILLATITARLVVGSVFYRSLGDSFMLLAKGGVDAALLLTAYTLTPPLIDEELYVASVVSIVVLSLAFAVPTHHNSRGSGVKLETRAGELALKRPVVDALDPLNKVAILLSAYPAVVVKSSDGRPLGSLYPSDLVGISPDHLDEFRAADVYRPYVVSVRSDSRLENVYTDEFLMSSPVIAVVDDKGRVTGVLYPQLVLRRLMRRAGRE